MSFDFNQQYNDDFKLEHIKIENILYFDDEKSKFVNADLELFGKSSILQTYDLSGELSKRSRNASNADILDYEIKQVEDNYIIMDLQNNILQVDYRNYLIIKEYYDKINSDYMTRYVNWANKVKNEAIEILKDEEFVRMINNFLKPIPTDFFTNPTLITQIEVYFINDKKFHGGKFLLLSDEIDRASYVKVEVTSYGDITYKREILDVQEAVELYVEDGLNPLSELIEDRYNFDDTKSAYLCYYLLNQIIKTKLSNEWENEFNEYFFEVENYDLQKCVEIYFEIDTINYKDINTAGKFIYYLMEHNKFSINENYIDCYAEFMDAFNNADRNYKKTIFEKRLKNNTEEGNKEITINDIDLMDGKEFENFIGSLFNKMGYRAEVTKHSGDQGIDVIAEKNGTKLGIQAKCYSGTVGNSAIQEAVAGKNYYNLDKVLVITNSSFTNSAIELARYNNVVLWDRNILKEKII